MDRISEKHIINISLITNLECAWDNNPSLQGLWKHIKASIVLYNPINQYKNTDMVETKRTWVHLCRIAK